MIKTKTQLSKEFRIKIGLYALKDALFLTYAVASVFSFMDLFGWYVIENVKEELWYALYLFLITFVWTLVARTVKAKKDAQ